MIALNTQAGIDSGQPAMVFDGVMLVVMA